MNLLKCRRIEGTGLGCRNLVRIMFIIFGFTDGRRDINPSFQHSSIQELLLGCVVVLYAAAKAELRLCLTVTYYLWVIGQTKSSRILMAEMASVK